MHYSAALYYSLLKLKYRPSIYLKPKKDLNKYASFRRNSHKNHTNRILPKNLQIDQSLFLCVLRDACHEYYFVFLRIFMLQGRRT